MRHSPSLRALVVLAALLAGGCEALTEPDEVGEPPVREVEGITTDVAAIVGTFAAGPMNHPFLLESLAEFQEFYGGVDPLYEASFQVRAFFENGGRRIWVSRTPDATLTGLTGGGMAGRGLLALEEANQFNALLVPELFTGAGIPDRAQAASVAITYAASRGAMMLLDPPLESTAAQDVIDWVHRSSSQIRNRHAALFFGRVLVPVGPSASRWIGASGAAAGVFAWNDRERGVWAAPAGLGVPAFTGVLDTDPLTADQREALNRAQIISLQRGPARLWGSRTLADDNSPFTFLPVQRLTLHAEALVRDALTWTPGQTMGQALWSRAQADAEAVFQDLWTRGAFPGLTPGEAYFVRSDVSTHTQADLTSGRLKVLIGFAPLRPGEFVVRILTFQL